ncbi:venom carboxylesterase-6-like [Hyposmocoma kahamanoa]|uniref:venom carboxylesterase-6-like n=1 Tax=Hyposmocoma kahamanoa TaxID=1477025 RepID=UPI000E6D91F1|nr:venom carboxylesterase-6-like [Hyposmocoma kahamanoa]
MDFGRYIETMAKNTARKFGIPSRLAVVTALAVAQHDEKPIVKIAHGVVQGTWKISASGRTYGSFEGVPYASPPLGKYRFREPQALESWPGLWDASRPSEPCLQYNPLIEKVIGSEDCLRVNVYSPKPYKGADLPVVMYIHGGAFMYGAGDVYNPVYIMDRDLVVVTLNYRLGPLGFLSTGDEVVPGNAGLKDQSMALHWIQDNILMFGGNPDSVTITGGSAGGASVNYHYLSPMSKGLFARGIAFSGSAFTPWALQIKPAEKAKALAAAVECPTVNHKDLVDCMRDCNADLLVAAQAELMDWKVHMFTPFTPTVEAPQVKKPFLIKYPYHAAQDGDMYNVPLITSVTSEEGLYPAAMYQRDPELLQELEHYWEELSSNIFEYNDTLPLERRPEVAARIKQKYLAGKPVGQETFPQLVQALGDRLFVVDVGKLAQVHAAKSGQPVYVYRYSFRGDISLSYIMALTKRNYGVSHADDVLHIFEQLGLTSNFRQDKLMTEAFLDMVDSYANTGIPKLGNTPWLPVVPGSAKINYLEITSPGVMEMKNSSDFGHRSFWNSLGFIENENHPDHFTDEHYSY